MSFYILIRGPLGIGKSTVSVRLARELRGRCISIDRILEHHSLWESGRLSEFLRANRFAVGRARPLLARSTPVIFDGNFYWKTQIEELIGRLGEPHFVFTLEAPLAICVERDRRRPHPYGPRAVAEVYAKSTRFDYGIAVEASGTLASALREIGSHLPR